MKRAAGKDRSITIGNRVINSEEPCYIIVEIGSNHNGNLKLAMDMVHQCHAAGVDAVKFQAFRRDTLYIEGLPGDAADENQQLLNKRWNILPQFTSDPLWWPDLKRLCDELGLDFLCTPFSLEAVEDLLEVNIPAFKIASGDITWLELIRVAAQTGKPLILSTGASNAAEVEAALEVARGAGCREIALLHCVSTYPTEWEDANLRALTTIRQEFNVPVGLSDHSPGSLLPVAARTLGACIIEKHVTTDRRQEGLDHHFALEMSELASLVEDIRKIEKAMGSGDKVWAANEQLERYWVRRGIWTSKALESGTVVTREKLKVVRPCQGLGAESLEKIIGKTLVQTVGKNHPLKIEDLE